MSSASLLPILILAGAVLALVAGVATAEAIVTVPVGNVGNAADTTGYGAVGYKYGIGKYEVTAAQYMEFLNAVADADTYGLYNAGMDDVASWYSGCGIVQSGPSGSYTYSLLTPAWANRPVNYVSWGDAARFANWLHRGKPTGPQGPLTTERGSYNLDGAMTWTQLMAVNRTDDATWVIPTEDEWYKAAYYDPRKGGPGSPGYWDYPMKSDLPTVPSNDLTTPDGSNNANFKVGAYDLSVGQPYFRSEFGDFEYSESAYNTFDQGGNVREWTEDRGDTTWFRYTRGGDWDSDSSYLQAGTVWGYSPIQEYQMVGFRLGVIPEPGSIVLLLGAAAAGCVCWRRGK